MHALAEQSRLSEGEAEELVALNHWVHTGPDVPAPDEMRHLIVMPVANEDYSIIEQSLDEILATDYRMDRVMLCLTFEERSKVWTAEMIARLEAAYGPKFAMVMTTRHPDGLPGEGRVKGANISWGAQLARQELHRRGLRDEQIIVSAFDADTRPSHNYFQVLTYSYLTNPGRDIDSYQPVLLFHNNVWDVTTASRLVGYIASMWTLVDSTRPGAAADLLLPRDGHEGTRRGQLLVPQRDPGRLPAVLADVLRHAGPGQDGSVARLGLPGRGATPTASGRP